MASKTPVYILVKGDQRITCHRDGPVRLAPLLLDDEWNQMTAGGLVAVTKDGTLMEPSSILEPDREVTLKIPEPGDFKALAVPDKASTPITTSKENH